ncbi:hypothetical protein MMC08_003326 [Hypocenomyce scalaris]|nr:hypothetical protein [Hypocenomyce scalaris]
MDLDQSLLGYAEFGVDVDYGEWDTLFHTVDALRPNEQDSSSRFLQSGLKGWALRFWQNWLNLSQAISKPRSRVVFEEDGALLLATLAEPEPGDFQASE